MAAADGTGGMLSRSLQDLLLPKLERLLGGFRLTGLACGGRLTWGFSSSSKRENVCSSKHPITTAAKRRRPLKLHVQPILQAGQTSSRGQWYHAGAAAALLLRCKLLVGGS